MKNPLKKSISIAVAIIMVASSAALFTGCGKAETSSSSQSSEDATGYKQFKWPDSDIAALLPTPKSSIGEIASESSGYLYVYVAETSSDDYSDYVDKCREKGFKVDYRKGDSYYYADNDGGYHLSISYDEEEKVMSVRISEPDEETTAEESSKEESSKEESSKEEESKSEDDDSDSVSSDFKEAMDSYEKFFDEYVDFMKKYKESDNPADMLSDYSDYLKQYTDTMSKMGKVDKDKLSKADKAYYVEVSARITKKLAEVSGY